MHCACRLLSRLVAVAVCLTLPHVAAADPLVLRNGSYLEGGAFIRQGASVAETFYATWYNDRFLSPSGTDSFADGLSLSSAGVQIALNSHLTTSIAPARFSAAGGAAGAINASATLDPEAWMNGLAFSQFVIEFILFEPYTFSFTGHYLAGAATAEAPLFSRSTSAVLYRVIQLGPDLTATENYVSDHASDEQRTQYSGILEPGRYFLQGRAAVLLTTPNSSGSSDFEVDLALAPVPEPATLLFVATGLAGMLGYRRRSGRARHSQSKS